MSERKSDGPAADQTLPPETVCVLTVGLSLTTVRSRSAANEPMELIEFSQLTWTGYVPKARVNPR